MEREEVAWQMMGNLMARLSSRLAVVGLLLATTTFLVAVLASVADGSSSVQGLNAIPLGIALGLWGIAIALFLAGLLKLTQVQSIIRNEVDDLLDSRYDDMPNDRANALKGAYAYSSGFLTTAVRFTSSGIVFVILGIIPGVWSFVSAITS